MMTTKDIIQAVGKDFIVRECGVSIYSIRAAIREKVFPASWYAALKAECDRLGLACPMELFSFKQPDPSVSDDAA